MPPVCEQTVADGEFTFPRRHKTVFNGPAELKIYLTFIEVRSEIPRQLGL